MTTQYAALNIADAQDLSPGHGMGEICEARFLREALGAEKLGISHYNVKPGKRLGFGHSHTESEEMYVVLSGSGRMKIDDDIVDLAAHDVIYCSPPAMREWEAGPDGLEMLAFGHHIEGDATLERGWWTD